MWKTKPQGKYFQERTLHSEQILSGFVVSTPSAKTCVGLNDAIPCVHNLCKDWMTQYLG
jgi:hypothetical protein